MQCDTLKWTAIYQDGTEVDENSVDSSEKIDRDKLKEFRLFKGDKLVFVAFFDKHRKLIFRKRTFLDMAGAVSGVVYLVGWHSKVGEVSIKAICYVYEDGHIEFDNSRDDLMLVPCEEF